METLDLARTSVFLDFDGTISTSDVGVHLLERFADGWLDYDDAFAAGLIGSRECMAEQWKCIRPRTTEPELRASAAEVELDAGLAPLVAGLRSAGAEITVVSDGYGFYVRDALASFALDVLTNEVDFATGTITHPYFDSDCPCGLCGTCKRAPILEAKQRGRSIVFVGDGVSDRRAAPLADRLYAKDRLAEWCDAEQLPYIAFATLADVADHLL
ncbi:MAG TPA: HAD-IB family phosphatase [Acidimicrobiales bacterium]|nr:HAD-IB family phosphatase [Acidimicrobiales bacterium]